MVIRIDIKKIARQRIARLFELAEQHWSKRPDLSQRYVTLARKIAMKNKVRMPRVYKRKYCPHCYSFFVPSATGRVRVQNGKIIYACTMCKHFWRMPIPNRR